MDIKRHLEERALEYQRILREEILPYWMDKTEPETGGFYTCYNVYGDRLVSRDKYVWSQGRCVWIYAKLALSQQAGLPEQMRRQCRRLAEEGCLFLEKYCILPDGRSAFVLDEKNAAKVVEPLGSRSVSTFADCFVAMGLAADSVLENRPDRAVHAYRLLTESAGLLRKGEFQTAPDILPPGWHGQAPYMILINTACEVAKALETFGLEEESRGAEEICRSAVQTELRYFLREDRILLECLDERFRPLDSLYGRHINPGHTQECMWFIMQAAEKYSIAGAKETALSTVKHMSKMAWDQEYGGMYYYLDRDGGRPRGEEWEEERHLAQAALRDWSNKMWWPQLESMTANLMGWILFQDLDCLSEYERCHDYAFSTFPSSNPAREEWIQIRDRMGRPLTEPVGGRLPVKDPYHLLRTLMFLPELIHESLKGV